MKTFYFSFFTILILFTSCENDRIENNSTINFVDVMTITVDTLEMDMVGDTNNNSLYLSYSPYNDTNDNILKIDILTNSQTIEANPDPTDSRQLSINGNNLYSFGVDNVIKMDMNLNNAQTVNIGYNIFFYSRAIQNGNEILFSFGQNNLISYDILTDSYLGTLSSDPVIIKSDGAVVNNKLYSFGGNYWTQNLASNKIQIYDLASSIYTESNLPYTIYESFVTTFQGNLIVAGNKNIDQSGAFLAIYNPITSSYTDISTTLDLNSISIRSISIINNDMYIAYCQNYIPMSTMNTIKIVKSSL